MQPYHENLVHYNWHWFWDFGNGELGNNGIHFIDVLRWGMQKKLPVRVHSTGGRFGYKDQGQTPNTQNVTWVYEDGSMIVGQLRGLYTAEPTSWDFFGTKGHMHIMADGRSGSRWAKQAARAGSRVSDESDHFQNFADAVRARDPQAPARRDRGDGPVHRALPPRQYLVSRRTESCSSTARKMQFIGDSEANKLLTREYRKPYVVPEKV